jgi:hypothetical protein
VSSNAPWKQYKILVLEKNNNCGLDSKILALTFLRGKCDEKLYILNLALILISQFMWTEQIKSYNGNTISNNIIYLLLHSV